MESLIKDENYVIIQGWMLNRLGLKNNELNIYAVIYGFSQTDDTEYSGSLQYLADWCNCTKQGVMKCLHSLLEKGYIFKTETIKNKLKFCSYRANLSLLNKVTTIKQSLTGSKQSLIGGVKQSLTNNIDLDIKDNNINNKKEKKSAAFDDIINNYTENETLRTALIEFIKMRKTIRKPVTSHGLELLLTKKGGLFDLSGGNDEIATQIVNQSIELSWTGFYPLKTQKAENRKETVLEMIARL